MDEKYLSILKHNNKKFPIVGAHPYELISTRKYIYDDTVIHVTIVIIVIAYQKKNGHINTC